MMTDFIINGVFWVFAIYGLIEIVKTIFNFFAYTNIKTKGIYVIIATKNQEEKIEGFVRSILSRLVYGKETAINNLMIVDLNSVDRTNEILKNLEMEYGYIKVVNWNECKEIIGKIEKDGDR